MLYQLLVVVDCSSVCVLLRWSLANLTALNNYEFWNILACICQVRLQKYNTEAGAVKYKNGLHFATRILQTEGVLLFNFFQISVYHYLSCLFKCCLARKFGSVYLDVLVVEHDTQNYMSNFSVVCNPVLIVG